MNEMHR